MSERTVLLPDLDGEIEAALDALNEILIGLAWLFADELDADPSWQPPAELEQLQAFYDNTAPIGGDAFSRIFTALRDAGEQSGRVLAPDGRYEHLPIRVVLLDDVDVARFGSVITGVRDLVARHDEIVTEIIEQRTAGHRSAAEVVEAVARVHQLVALDPTELTPLLVDELGDGHGDVVLSLAGEACYQTVADRLVSRYHDSAIDRYLY